MLIITVGALGLLDNADATSAELVLAHRIQDFNRFLLERLNKEEVQYADTRAPSQSQSSNSNANVIKAPTIMERLFGFQVLQHSMCLGGKHQNSRVSTSFHITLNYPTVRRSISFVDLLTQSLREESAPRVWCAECNTFQVFYLLIINY